MTRLGRPRLHLRATDSTNIRARELALGGAPHGTLVTATEQAAGRGRQGRSWAGPPGRALLMSLLLREPPPLLPLLAAVAVADVCGEAAEIKWPNDVLIEGRKVAGILVEGRPQERWAIVGIGVNVAVRADDLPEDLRDRAGGLGRAPEDLEPALAELLHALEHRLGDVDGSIVAWRGRDTLAGRAITWSGGHGGAGTAAGIDDEGRLLVDLPDGTRTSLDAGEVHLQTLNQPS